MSPGERFVHRLAFLPEKLVRTGEPHLFARLHVGHHHVALESPRTNAHECEPIAMLRIHVRLDLEDEAGKLRIIGRDDAFAGMVRRGGAERARKASSSSCTPKLFNALPKKTGVSSAGEDFIGSSTPCRPCSSISSSSSTRA